MFTKYHCCVTVLKCDKTWSWHDVSCIQVLPKSARCLLNVATNLLSHISMYYQITILLWLCMCKAYITTMYLLHLYNISLKGIWFYYILTLFSSWYCSNQSGIEYIIIHSTYLSQWIPKYNPSYNTKNWSNYCRNNKLTAYTKSTVVYSNKSNTATPDLTMTRCSFKLLIMKFIVPGIQWLWNNKAKLAISVYFVDPA